MAKYKFAHRRIFGGKVYTLSSIESKSTAKVLAKQMRATGRNVRLVPDEAFGRVAIYSRWARR